MSVDVLSEVAIARPLAEVAAFAAEPDNAPAWYVNIKSVEWKSDRPLRIGSKVAFVAHFLGRRLAYTYEVTEFAPSQRLVMRTSEGPFPMETTYTWEPTVQGATRMTLRNRGSPSGFSQLVAPVMAAAMRRANRNDLARLKLLLEHLSHITVVTPNPSIERTSQRPLRALWSTAQVER
jgi:uncharacterized membrane protein